MTEDWNKTAEDYARHRAGFPDWFYDRLEQHHGFAFAGKEVLDLATGTGNLARGFAKRGARVTGIDIAKDMIEAAKTLDEKEGVFIDYRLCRAEDTGLLSDRFDIISAGTCWHWFEGAKAAREILRLLRPGGSALLCMLSWLPIAGNLVDKTEKLVQRYNSRWKYFGMNGLKPEYLADLREAGFGHPVSFSVDYDIPYSPEDWCGRMRASAGIAASLPRPAVEDFDRDLRDLLKKEFPMEILSVPHRLFAVLARK